MLTAISTGAVVCLLLVALGARLVSAFFFMCSITALLAAFDLVPAGSTDTLQLLWLAALWVELAQIEVASSGNSGERRNARNQDWKQFWASLAGLTVGTILWYVFDGAAALALVWAFGGAFFLNYVRGEAVGTSLRRALTSVEQSTAGVVMKLCMCMLMLLSLSK